MNDRNYNIGAVVVIDKNNAIGNKGGLLCYLPNDLKHFKNITSGHTIIMGRRTFESLPKGALPNRTNIVISSTNPDNFPGCITVKTIEEALDKCDPNEEIFIIGGGQLYNSTIDITNNLFLTRIHHAFEEVDTYFPNFDLDEWILVEEEHHKADEKHEYNYSFLKYRRK
mgnify:FL=1